MLELVGMLGATMLALCPLPQAIRTVRTQSAQDISWPFLLLWFGGEVLLLSYVAADTGNTILLANYCANLLCLVPILWVKVREL